METIRNKIAETLHSFFREIEDTTKKRSEILHHRLESKFQALSDLDMAPTFPNTTHSHETHQPTPHHTSTP